MEDKYARLEQAKERKRQANLRAKREIAEAKEAVLWNGRPGAEFGTPPEAWAEFPLGGKNPVRGFSAPVIGGQGEFGFRRGQAAQQGEVRRPVPVRSGLLQQFGFRQAGPSHFQARQLPDERPAFQPIFPPAAGRVNLGPPGFRHGEQPPPRNLSAQRSFHTPAEQQSVSSPVTHRNPPPETGRQSAMASSRPVRAALPKERKEDKSSDSGEELRARLKNIEKQLHANKAKTAIESEMKKLASAINPVTIRGLLLQHEMYAAIYAAEKNQKGGLALAGDFGVFIRNRCRRLSYMAEDICTYAQQKVAELGEDATDAEISEVDKKILRFYPEINGSRRRRCHWASTQNGFGTTGKGGKELAEAEETEIESPVGATKADLARRAGVHRQDASVAGTSKPKLGTPGNQTVSEGEGDPPVTDQACNKSAQPIAEPPVTGERDQVASNSEERKTSVGEPEGDVREEEESETCETEERGAAEAKALEELEDSIDEATDPLPGGPCQIPFQYDKLRDVLVFTFPGSFMVTGDLKSGYFHVPIHPAYWKYFGFKIGKKTFFYKVLCFGFAQACWVFTTVMKEPIVELRRLGIPLSGYVDDLFTAAETFGKALRQILFTRSPVRSSGGLLRPSQMPAGTAPGTEVVGLPRQLNFTETFSLTEARRIRIEKALQEIVDRKLTSARAIAKLAGMLASAAPAVLPVSIYSRSLYEALSNRTGWDALFPNPETVVQTAKFWLENLGSQEEALRSSSEREVGGYAAALQVVAEQAPEEIKGRSVLVIGDSQAGVSALTKCRSAAPFINSALQKLVELSRAYDFDIAARWVPREEIEEADALSREPDPSDWGLSPKLYNEVTEFFSVRPAVDLFASSHLHVAPVFVSKYYTPECSGILAQSLDWSRIVARGQLCMGVSSARPGRARLGSPPEIQNGCASLHKHT
ncbi:putative DNA/RNA polymerases [Klebsormidium nitens]|uniref:Putative DNA/RNA polymerases n=1 Tax=Klebsormidium nitens TaxID=105231 RepID=A0A1Y1HU66_KLENI|nr:putative DNA/RNA polymerases [Klebsormidium nitens]|eukprot:GAQ80066.1 putative DNA/RNA polymerases [Klebsormidium nitens]